MLLRKLSIYVLLFLLVACGQTDEGHADHAHQHEGTMATFALPDFKAVDLAARKLKVVATTNIIGDVVDNIGRDTIDLTILIGRNQDPHSYQPTPQDFVALEEADVIFVNGWHLEEQLADVIEESFAEKMVMISAEITPRQFENESVDPHVWFSIHNVEQWAQNTAQLLTKLDPNHATAYTDNLADYQAELSTLEQEVETLLTELPSENRKLVTNHAALGYFADEYDFDVIGTVIPSFSSSAEPSASDLADLAEVMKEEGVCTLFGETSKSADLVETISAELTHCDQVQLHSLYTESIGEGDAASYIGMFRTNVETIVAGLR